MLWEYFRLKKFLREVLNDDLGRKNIAGVFWTVLIDGVENGEEILNLWGAARLKVWKASLCETLYHTRLCLYRKSTGWTF